MTNPLVVGIDLGERESAAIVLSPAGDVVRSFSFAMNEEYYESFNDVVPKKATSSWHIPPNSRGYSHLERRTTGWIA